MIGRLGWRLLHVFIGEHPRIDWTHFEMTGVKRCVDCHHTLG